MTDTKYRGLTQNGWVYGLPFYNYGSSIWCITYSNGWQPTYNNPDEGESTVFSSVDPKTIGKYTGFTDKNKKEIYDGDIIGDWSIVDGKKVQSRLQVFWNETTGQWCVDLSAEQDKSYCDALWTELRDFDYEILGHIHEK